MNKIYKNNLQLLKNFSPAFYETVSSINGQTVRGCRTRKNKINIIKSFKGKELFIHSNYDPIEQAKAVSKFSLEENNDIIFVFGLGLGYELKEMIKKDYKKNYFIVEPDKDIYKAMLENVDIKFMTNHNITFILNDDPNIIANDFSNFIREKNTTSVKFSVLPSYQYIYSDLISKTFEKIKNVLLMLQGGFNTSIFTAKQWALNYSNNLQYLYETEPLSKLHNAFQGMPAVIVGAGPSLDENIEHLKKIFNKALIVTGGSGISVAENNEIKCHIAGAMDGWWYGEKIFEDLKINKDINLFYSSQVFSLVPSMVKGRKFLFNQVEMDYFINKKMKWDYWSKFSGPSITNVLAFHLAKLGCNPIIFVGQDLCYSKQKLYAKGAAFESRKPEDVTSGFIEAKNIQGEEVFTDRSFINMKNSMEFAIKLNPSTKYLNGTKYGVHIEGAEDINFNDYVDNILLKEKDYDFQSIIDEKYGTCCDESKKEKIDLFLNKLKKDIEQVLIVFKDILIFIDNDDTKEKKEKYILKNEKVLEKNELFVEFLKPMFDDLLKLMYKERQFLDMKKQAYCFYYDKCNSMNNNLEITLKEIYK